LSVYGRTGKCAVRLFSDHHFRFCVHRPKLVWLAFRTRPGSFHPALSAVAVNSRSRLLGAIALSRRCPLSTRSLASFRLSLKLQRPHQPCYTLSDHIMAPVQQVQPDAAHALGVAAVREAPADIPDQFLVVQSSITGRSRAPAAEPTWRDIENPAHPCHRPDPSMLRNELELHAQSFAK
jgi:hypothetical protein